MTITTSTVEVDGGRLDVESWGDPGDPTVLLLAGTSCTRDWWPPSFCHSLMARKALVIRFDQRDTGSSTHWPVGAPAYGLPDLVDDAIAVLDALGISDAHLVGFSQGGWVAQNLGVHHPDRVASSLSSRPARSRTARQIRTYPRSPAGSSRPGTRSLNRTGTTPPPSSITWWRASESSPATVSTSLPCGPSARPPSRGHGNPESSDPSTTTRS